MDIVMITRDRPTLTEQTIRSMRENASDWSRHRLIVVFDGTVEERAAFELPKKLVNSAIIVTGKQLGVGGAKNFGTAYIERQLEIFNKAAAPVKMEHAPNSLLMFSDNDLYYLPGWDTSLTDRINRKLWNLNVTPILLGGWRHPFHGINQRHRWPSAITESGYTNLDVCEVDAVTGCCFVMRWSDWLRYGPFDANAIGPGQSEDFALSQRVRAGGGLCATLDPPVAIHCGLVNSSGEPATGWREMGEMARAQLLWMPESERSKVILEVPAEGAPGADVVDRQYRQRQQLADKLNDAAVVMGLMRPVSHPAEGYLCPRCGSKLYWSGRPGCIHACLSCRPLGLNVGSGQRPFTPTDELAWLNVDVQSVPPDRVPGLICNVGVERLPLPDGAARYVVLHQVLEHNGCGEATPMLRECWRVLAPGGSLIVTVPDMRALAGRWLGGELDTQLFMTNVYGAYMGDDADRHRWGYIRESLREYLIELFSNQVCNEGHECGNIGCTQVKSFDWRQIPGADIARDWWVLGIEAVKS